MVGKGGHTRWVPITAALVGTTTRQLRHRAATAAYAKSRDLRAVQELLGHARPETTAIYTEVDHEDMLATIAPLA